MRRARSRPSATVAFVVFVCLALAGLAGWREYLSYGSELEETEAYTLNIAKSLAQHADDTVEMANSFLGGIVDHFESERLAAGLPERLRRHLVAQGREVPRLSGLFVFDERGDLVASSLADAPEAVNVADRTYFKHHASSTDRGPFIGDPIRSRTDGQWLITVSRRMQHPDGSFGGIAAASLDVAYFSRFFSQFDLGPKSNISLFRRDGTVLARWPRDDAAIGRSFPGSSLFADVLVSPAGNRRYASRVDGVERISGYQQGGRFGLVLQAAVAQDTALARWREQSIWRSAGVGLLIVLIGVIGLRMADQVRRREQSEAALQQGEARFRLLAENSGDMVSRIDGAGRRLYVSPASERLLGWRPEELQARSPHEDIHPDDHESLENLIRAFHTGEVGEATLAYRAFHRSGRELWLETSLRVTHDSATGERDGVVAVSRDITERKLLEAKLKAMARTDGLTGLANRRAFDEALASEWRRSERKGAALSLLLLDVDRFKLFNDSYGHQAGDECLQVVSGAIAGLIRREGDVVARYGGEEIVFLLPSTAELGALAVGERARAAVQALALRHERNPPSSVVTVSVGVATFAPVEGEIGSLAPEHLVEAADQALYRAKQAGRNRVMAAPHVLGSRRFAA